MLSALPLLLGVQLILNFLSHDMATTPRDAIHRAIGKMQILPAAGSPDALSDTAALALADDSERRVARPLEGGVHV